MAVNDDRTIKDILSLPDTQRKALYKATDIEKVTIDGNVFTDYKAFSFIWEKSYVKSPERSGSGVIGNLDSYATFLTPHLKIDFSMMSIDSYRTMMNLIYNKNEFLVTCYDVVHNEQTTNKMYFATEEMPKLWTIARALNGEEWTELLGVQDYTVELIGTNAELDKVSIIYHKNPPAGQGSDSTVGVSGIYKNTDVVLGKSSDADEQAGIDGIVSETYDNAYKFKRWNTKADGTGTNYFNNSVYTLNESLTLYAVWQDASSHTLSFNYGLAEPALDSQNNPIYSKQVQQNIAVGTLPGLYFAPVEYEGQTYDPFYNVGWYKTKTKSEVSRVTSDTLYWYAHDAEIYALCDIDSYAVYYYVDGEHYSTASVKYGAEMQLPTLVRSGYTFDGWYKDSNYTNQFTGTMPPRSISLYARFILE